MKDPLLDFASMTYAQVYDIARTARNALGEHARAFSPHYDAVFANDPFTPVAKAHPEESKLWLDETQEVYEKAMDELFRRLNS